MKQFIEFYLSHLQDYDFLNVFNKYMGTNWQPNSWDKLAKGFENPQDLAAALVEYNYIHDLFQVDHGYIYSTQLRNLRLTETKQLASEIFNAICNMEATVEEFFTDDTCCEICKRAQILPTKEAFSQIREYGVYNSFEVTSFKLRCKNIPSRITVDRHNSLIYLWEQIQFAQALGDEYYNNLVEKFTRLSQWEGEIKIYQDYHFPHCFIFHQTYDDGRNGIMGGIVFHGAPEHNIADNGGSVTLTPVSGWAIHT